LVKRNGISVELKVVQEGGGGNDWVFKPVSAPKGDNSVIRVRAWEQPESIISIVLTSCSLALASPPDKAEKACAWALP
jgi:hypothetical protein